MSATEEARFHHLLAPLRDLAKNWNIDIATDLEDYLDELDKVSTCAYKLLHTHANKSFTLKGDHHLRGWTKEPEFRGGCAAHSGALSLAWFLNCCLFY
jgi:hypothetical protein